MYLTFCSQIKKYLSNIHPFEVVGHDSGYNFKFLYLSVIICEMRKMITRKQVRDV